MKAAAGLGLVGLILSLGVPSEARAAMSLKGVTLEDAPGEFTVIFWSDPPIQDYHYAFPRNPLRLAIDLPGKWRKPDKRTYRLENDTIKRITVDWHPDRLRATLHLKAKRVFEPFFYDSIKGLIVTVKKAQLFTKPLPKGVKVAVAEGDDGPDDDPRDAPRALGQAATGSLANLALADLPDGFRLTVALDRAPAGYSTFTLLDEAPPKLVLDVEGPWRNPGDTVRPLRNDSLQRVRVGEHPDFLRVVMDLGFKGAPRVDETADGRTVVLEVLRPAQEE